MSILSTVKILERARIRRKRTLPTPGEVLVAEGDILGPDTEIAKAEFVKGNPCVIDLRAELKTKLVPELLDDVLLKKQGDVVKAGEPVARYQKSFWSEIAEAKSPCDGVIEYISKTQARVIVREDPRSAKPMSVVAAASRLRVSPRFLRMFTTVKEGDFVYEGKVIATTDGMDFVYAPISGVVERICPLTGTIVIVKPIKLTKVLAHAEGRVTEIIPYYGAVIESVGAYIQGIFGIGGECFGELMMMSDGPDEPFKPDRINESLKGKILVCGSYASFDSVERARQEGALGLVTGGMDQLDLVRASGEELGVGLTGLEDMNFTIVILEGFGEIAMNGQTWGMLKKNVGKIASLKGATQIRAGVVRPEIIIGSIGEYDKDASVDTSFLPLISEEIDEMPRVTHGPLHIGDRVRCTRPPYFGMWGVVKGLPEESRKVECEALLEVAEVKLDCGDSVIVPRVNLEVF